MYRLLIFLLTLILIVTVNYQVIDLKSLSKKHIIVEVNGATSTPGFYKLEKGSTIKDLLSIIEISEDADLKTINKQIELSDKDLVYIPIIKENNALISINTAPLEQLMLLPGIGESTAKKIVEYRDKKLFQTIEEIKNISGIGEVKYGAICKLICL